MPKKEEQRRYNLTDADLKQKGDDVVTLVNRDLADLAVRNITTGTVENLEDSISTFDNLETDEELQGVIEDATQAKDILAEDIRKKIRSVRNMAELQYGGKGKYNSFGLDDMASMSDNELHRLSKRVVRVATKLVGELSTQGLTEQQITDLSTAGSLFDLAIDAQHKAIEDRDLGTEARITQGNSLWAEMVRICSIGKAVYQDTDEAKYNDYVLTESSAPKTDETPVT